MAANLNPESIKARKWINNYFIEKGNWPTGSTIAKNFSCSLRQCFKLLAQCKNNYNVDNNIEINSDEDFKITRSNGRDVSVRYTENRDGKTIQIDSLKIITLDDAIQLAQIDLDIWEVANSEFSTWNTPLKLKIKKQDKNGKFYFEDEVKQVTNYRTFIRLKPKKTISIKKAIDNLVKNFVSSPYISTPIKKEDCGLLFVPSLYDVHIGKFAWKKETHDDSQDLKIIRNVFRWAVDKLFSRVEYNKIERILAVIGHDWLHIDNQEGITRKGENRLDFDSRLIKVMEVAYQSAIDFVYRCLEVAPVDVVWVPGNHDEITSYALCRILKEHFKENKNVSVDIGETYRKSYLWGTTLIGMTHQSMEPIDKLPNILALEWPELWGKSKYRELLIGHTHKKEEKAYFPTQTVGRVLVRRVPSMSAIDAWHYQNGYVDAIRAAEGYLYHKTEGNIATVEAIINLN